MNSRIFCSNAVLQSPEWDLTSERDDIIESPTQNWNFKFEILSKSVEIKERV